MAVLPIYHFPHPVLKQKSKRVRSIDSSIRKLIDDMIETMHYVHGVGLAAPQVGVPLRIIVIGLPEQEDIALINPEIVRREGERLVEEACFSVPGYFSRVKHAVSVTAKGRNQNGKEIRIKADGRLAQVLEHEIDHLNGVLYIDHPETMGKIYRVEAPDTTRQLI